MAKETKRSRVKYPGLTKEVNPKTRQEYMDQDYIDELSDDEKQWLSNFMEEYMSGNFNHKGHKLHRSKENKRACYTRNNARNRDLYAICRSRGWVVGSEARLPTDERNETNKNVHEEVLVSLIDLKDEVENADSLKNNKNTTNRSKKFKAE